MSVNPYAQLKQKLVACLKIESKMTAEERESNQMSFLVKLGGTQVTLIKGGVNTIALQMGKGQRRVMFPDEALETLDKLSKQTYWYYRVSGPGFAEGGTVFFGIGRLLKEPSLGGPGKIVGVGPKGDTVLYMAKPNLNGGFEWQEAKRK